MTETTKQATIRGRVSMEIKEKFTEIAKSKSMTESEYVRYLVLREIESFENKKERRNMNLELRVNLDLIVEHLQEMGKVVVNGFDNISELKAELSKRGIETKFESSDRDYLVKI